MIAANLPLTLQQVNQADVMGAMLSQQTYPSSWTSEAQIQDPLPQGVAWRRLVVISFAPQRHPGVMGPAFRQDDTFSVDAARP